MPFLWSGILGTKNSYLIFVGIVIINIRTAAFRHGAVVALRGSSPGAVTSVYCISPAGESRHLLLLFLPGFATFICIAPGRRRCAQLEVSPPLLVACARVTLFLGLLWITPFAALHIFKDDWTVVCESVL
ncbi:hypothetical protein AK812_SmicGene47925 [Symbiodinium microadriaticum]|uniref:Uncharacterized protein n=1 Tax=Symbiodinium microadriaticum TaxID=2951 RepID=A0A1Q9BQQ3_SYMMI|nr:hypothetical protein AK812_SmicGene47925 [Symbiodinium microadriaticum]